MDHPTNGQAPPAPKRPRKRKPLDIRQYPPEFRDIVAKLADPNVSVCTREFPTPDPGQAFVTRNLLNRFLRECRERGEGEIKTNAEIVSQTYSFVADGRACVTVKPKSDSPVATALYGFLQMLEAETQGLDTLGRPTVRAAGAPETDPYAAIYRTAPMEPVAAISSPAPAQEAIRGPLTAASIYGEDYAPQPASVVLQAPPADPLTPYSEVRAAYWTARSTNGDRLSARRDGFAMLVDTGHPLETAAAIMDRIEREGPLEGKSPDER